MRHRILVIAVLLGAATLQAQSQVTFDRILHADREPQNWLSYSGTPMNQRYSGLTQITPANVKNLQLQWIWQARSLEKFEATPLVVDGVMYLLASLSERLPWPPNVWMGVSVESQHYAFRADHLRSVPAAIRFLSVEPLLGPVTLALDGLHWVIVGGESGHHARPLDPRWVEAIRDQCVEAGVAFFFKQWGGRTPKANGRSLNGRTWDDKPGRSGSATAAARD